VKKLSIVTPCYNEEGNVEDLCERIRAVGESLKDRYEYEHILIDNASKDRTVELIKRIAAQDPRVKLIVNVRNFGHIRSPYYGFLQATGDLVMLMASDLQDPPELIPQFIEKWEAGYKIVIGVKSESEETPVMFAVRKMYYDLISKISDIELVKNYTGFGLYDQVVVQELRKIDDPYPYFRGLISELGFEKAKIYFRQPQRKRGISANNFYTLYDIAMLGITSHSKVPLRLATIAGFSMSLLSLVTAMAYLVLKLVYWNSLPFGMAPLLIGVFFFSSVQLFFIGLIGEYIGFIYTQILRRPLVIEKERVNFEGGAVPMGRAAAAPAESR
jgi:glycosyltransferase involved in cell wall biosynthesis